jgi:hypothetical protein
VWDRGWGKTSRWPGYSPKWCKLLRQGNPIREIFSPIFLENKALSKLLGHNAWRIMVWDYLYKLWWTTSYSVHCCLQDENVFNTLFCLGTRPY